MRKHSKVKSPVGSHSHWMAAILYTLKISLFREQLIELNIFKVSTLDKVDILGIFLVLLYVKYWLCCTSPSDAPILDLNMLKLFENASVEVDEKQMQEMINLSKQKLMSYLWYLSERLVPFAFFSSRVFRKAKAEMAKEIMKYKTNAQIHYTQDIPITNNFRSKYLKNFIGPDSWTFFELFNVEPTFLYKPVNQWSADDNFKMLSPIVRALKVVNDSAERALGMITNFHLDRITRSEEQKQYLLQVQHEIRSRQKGLMN